MLKHGNATIGRFCQLQPPSGGCVLKHGGFAFDFEGIKPAAFGRLCVETQSLILLWNWSIQPPSGGCVLKPAGYPAE